jgi:hypothetical protein
MSWIDANQRQLARALAGVRALLQARLPEESHAPEVEATADEAPSALDCLAATFGLSEFERQLLVLCAGIELDSSFAPLCAALHGDPARAYPTFSLALGILAEPYWSAIAPAGPLRRWRLIEIGGGGVLTSAPLRIEERVLHFLTGIDQLDERLAALVQPLPMPAELVPSQDGAAKQIASLWKEDAARTVQLCGAHASARRDVAASACAKLGLGAHVISAAAFPTAPADIESLVRLWERDAWLGGNALLIDCERLDGDAARAEAVRQFVDRARVPLLVSSRDPGRIATRAAATVEVPRISAPELRRVWHEALGELGARLDDTVDRVATQFVLPPDRVRQVAVSIRESADPAGELWKACRVASRRRLDELAQRIDAAARWDDLVLPAAQISTLRDIATAVRYRFQVYEQWGFAAKNWRGAGVSALFAGASGTGKTLAAEVIANELELDLYRIDLSGVVNKYVGETEKNLRRLFDAAEESGAILLFDEADALFGKRTEVRDSHDRFANIEVSYLLQRMESYRGLAILTTNSREALDAAFLRRLRFAVQFPFPGPAERTDIWRRVFPAATPTAGVDLAKLARLAVAGGNIRNIAVNAAVGAARDGTAVTMPLLLAAARGEYAKLEKMLPAADVEGWA